MKVPDPEVTQLLSRLRAGDPTAEAQLFERMSHELRYLAQAVFSGRAPSHTLQPTALVHEAWLKLAGNMETVTDRPHFLALAGRAMRQVLADHARGRKRDKRGGGVQRVTLHDFGTEREGTCTLLELEECLGRLSERNERHGKVAELRLFGGLTVKETAEVLGVTPRSTEDDWAMAKAWLRRELAPR